MKLNVKAIESIIKEATEAGKAKKAADGGGLYLEVTKDGGTYWRMKYRFMNKEKRLALGVYPRTHRGEKPWVKFRCSNGIPTRILPTPAR